MDAYIYQADLHCEDCIEKIKKNLKEPENLENEYSYDSDDYPKGPYPQGGGEANYPQHCDSCGLFLENPLTEDGEEYVKDAIMQYYQDGVGGGNGTIELWNNYYRITPEHYL